jgi:hypothetical protein
MKLWDIVDWLAVGESLVGLGWFWYTASRTVLDFRYPRDLRVPAYLHLAKGGLVFLTPLVLVLFLQHLVTGSP